MNYFVEEIQKNQITDPIEILNWYRNLYYTENSNTERGIMAAAINALFMKYKKERIKCEDCRYFNQKTSFGGFCKCSEIWGSRPRMRVNDDSCSYGKPKSVTYF